MSLSTAMTVGIALLFCSASGKEEQRWMDELQHTIVPSSCPTNCSDFGGDNSVGHLCPAATYVQCVGNPSTTTQSRVACGCTASGTSPKATFNITNGFLTSTSITGVTYSSSTCSTSMFGCSAAAQAATTAVFSAGTAVQTCGVPSNIANSPGSLCPDPTDLADIGLACVVRVRDQCGAVPASSASWWTDYALTAVTTRAAKTKKTARELQQNFGACVNLAATHDFQENLADQGLNPTLQFLIFPGPCTDSSSECSEVQSCVGTTVCPTNNAFAIAQGFANGGCVMTTVTADLVDTSLAYCCGDSKDSNKGLIGLLGLLGLIPCSLGLALCVFCLLDFMKMKKKKIPIQQPPKVVQSPPAVVPMPVHPEPVFYEEQCFGAPPMMGLYDGMAGITPQYMPEYYA